MLLKIFLLVNSQRSAVLMLKNTLFILFISIVTTACVSNKMSKYLDRHSKSKTTVSKKIPKMYPVSANVYRVQTSKERLWQETLRVLSSEVLLQLMSHPTIWWGVFWPTCCTKFQVKKCCSTQQRLFKQAHFLYVALTCTT